MTIDEALDIVVARTKHERFRALCDPSHPDYSPGYVPIVIAMAEGRPLAEPTPQPAPSALPSVAESRDMNARIRACPHRIKRQDCGCGVSGCALGKGRDGTVDLHNCRACLEAGDKESPVGDGPRSGSAGPCQPIPEGAPMSLYSDLITVTANAEATVTADTANLDAAKAAAAAAIAAAQAQLDTDTTVEHTAEAALGAALAGQKPVFVVLPDGTANIYQADGTGGFHVTNANPASSPVPAPTPPPATP